MVKNLNLSIGVDSFNWLIGENS